MMITTPYAAPCCEFDGIIEATALLGGSDLTDDGAGDMLTNGDEFTF